MIHCLQGVQEPNLSIVISSGVNFDEIVRLKFHIIGESTRIRVQFIKSILILSDFQLVVATSHSLSTSCVVVARKPEKSTMKLILNNLIGLYDGNSRVTYLC